MSYGFQQTLDQIRADAGSHLVAEEHDGGCCAIQCKFHAPGTRISKEALDSFISASAREPFTRRMVVDTGQAWGLNALKAIEGLTPACQVLRFNDLADRPIDWPNLRRQSPEALRWRPEPFSPLPHQKAAVEDVVRGLDEHMTKPSVYVETSIVSYLKARRHATWSSPRSRP